MALDAGPPFVEVEQSYPELLAESGWKLTDQLDLGEEFASTLALMAGKLFHHRGELESLMSRRPAMEERTRRANAAAASAKGILRRELDRAVPDE